MENIKLLFQLYFRPASAMSEIMDKGSFIFAAIAVLIISFTFQSAIFPRIIQTYAVSKYDTAISNFDAARRAGRLSPQELEEAEYYANLDIEKEMTRELRPLPIVGRYGLWLFSFESSFFTPFISLLVFYVPITLLLLCIFAGIGNFGMVLQRDYGTLATCSLMAWAAAYLPFTIIGFLIQSQPLDGSFFLGLWAISGLFFGLLMIFAVRTVFGVDYSKAILTIAISWLGFSLGSTVFQFIPALFFSPFILFYAIIYFGRFVSGGAQGFGDAFRQRQNFNRYLQSATVNPRDADAHVQLGLIYLQRRQQEKALEHLEKAVEIDANEIDAHYELGKIARQKGNYQSAINHFSIVVEQNDKFSLSEIWREIGATYLEAKMFSEAREALVKFTERRAFDPEGLYYLGKVLKAQSETEKAEQTFLEAIEAVKNSPSYRYREVRHWSKLAQKEIT